MAIEKAKLVKMGSLHENYLALINEGRKTKASGSQWNDRNDGGNNRQTQLFAFSWDGKSTLSAGITVTREMIAKVREHAGLDRPMLGLRFYANERLDEVAEDWVALPGADWAEVLQAAREGGALAPEERQELERRIQELCETAGMDITTIQEHEATIAELQQQLAAQQDADAEADSGDSPHLITRLREAVQAGQEAWSEQRLVIERMEEHSRAMHTTIERQDAELRQLRAANAELATGSQQLQQHIAFLQDQPAQRAEAFPVDPWRSSGLLVMGYHSVNGPLHYRGFRTTPGQPPVEIEVTSVRVQPDALNRDILYVNDQRVREGQLWIDGDLKYQAFPDAPAEQPHE